ncbi:hypothetical protein Tco_0657498 [Tanacetum coccineum]|uniref:Uncharacterized protein n=1 Tax=Tanacetum coccineum TaxID=301880 RepID=A0ABQ4XBY2_9ASTR
MMEQQGLIQVGETQHVVVMQLMEVGMTVEDLDLTMEEESTVDKSFVKAVGIAKEYCSELDCEGKLMKDDDMHEVEALLREYVKIKR